MLTRIFGQINSSTSILLAFFALALSIGHFFFLPVPDFVFKTAWGNVYLLPAAGYSIYGVALAVLLFGFQWLVEYKYKLLKKHVYFPFFFLLLILMFLGEGGLNLLLEMVLLLLVLASWFSVYHGEKLLGRTLNTGLLIGVGSIFDARIGLLLLVSFLVYVIFGRLNIRTFLILLVGYLTTWINALALEYIIFDSTTSYQLFLNIFSLNVGGEILELNLFSTILLAVLLVISLPEFISTFNRASVFKRQSYVVLLVLALLSGVLFYAGNKVFYLSIYIPVATILFVNFYQNIKRDWIKELILWIAMSILLLMDLAII